MHIKNKGLANLRTDYTLEHLSEANVDKNPITQFEKWLNEAIEKEVMEPAAMVLSTVNKTGVPSSRVVLLKDVQDPYFYFFTNYESRKGQDICENPRVSLLFFWPELQRQVRVGGMAKKADETISDEYFASRPRESRMGAISSPQSEKIESRDMLEDLMESVQKQFAEEEQIPRPKYWGGYKVEPAYIEFWQGGAGRLHDRLVFEKKGGDWEMYRIAP